MDSSQTNYELFQAIEFSDFQKVSQLLKEGVDPEEQNEQGVSALTIAAQKGNVEIIEMLLKAGASLDLMEEEKEEDNNDEDSLTFGQIETLGDIMSKNTSNKNSGAELLNLFDNASEYFDEETKELVGQLKQILDPSKGMNTTNPEAVMQQMELLGQLMFSSGDIIDQIPEEILQENFAGAAHEGKDKENEEDDDNNYYDGDEDYDKNATPFIAAIVSGHLEVVRFLLKHKKDLISQGSFDIPEPLYVAVDMGQLEIVRFLLEAGAEIDSEYESTPPLTQACIQGYWDIFKLLVDAGADIQWEDEEGFTTLMYAAMGGNLQIVQFLVEAGIDPNVWSEGETALLIAASRGEKDIFEYLKTVVSEKTLDDLGEELEDTFKEAQRQQENFDPTVEKFIDAAMLGKTAHVQKALQNGMDVNAVGLNGQTALMYAAFYSRIDVLQALLEAGADVNIRSTAEGPGKETGMTALMQIASSPFAHSRKDIIQMLFDAGANLNAQDDVGMTAIMHAITDGNGHPASIEILLQLGADPKIKNLEGNTALQLTHEKQGKIRKLLTEAME